MSTISEDGVVIPGPTNQTAGVKGPVLPIKKNVFKRVQDLKKKRDARVE